MVLGQVDVQAKTNEIPLFAALLDRIDLAGAVITAAALHAQRGRAADAISLIPIGIRPPGRLGRSGYASCPTALAKWLLPTQ